MLYMWTYCLTKSTNEYWESREYSTIPYKYTLPDNLCQYFWQLVIAIISLPLTIWCLPGQLLFGVKPNGYWIRLVYSIITLFIIFLIAVFGIKFMTDPAGYGIKISKVIGLIVGVIAIIALIVGIASKFKDLSDSDTVKIINAKIASKKSKICPRINWEEKK